MKKWILFSLLFACFITTLHAQIQRKRNLNTSDSAKTIVADSNSMSRKDMLRELNLTKVQMQQIKEARQSLKSKKEAVDANDKLSPQEKQQQLKDLRKEQAQIMMRILTPDQMQKLIQLRKQNKSGNSMNEEDN